MLQLKQSLQQIRTSIEAENLLQRFIVTDNDESLTRTNLLLREMYDLFESPIANDAMEESLNCIFTILHDHHLKTISQGLN